MSEMLKGSCKHHRPQADAFFHCCDYSQQKTLPSPNKQCCCCCSTPPPPKGGNAAPPGAAEPNFCCCSANPNTTEVCWALGEVAAPCRRLLLLARLLHPQDCCPKHRRSALGCILPPDCGVTDVRMTHHTVLLLCGPCALTAVASCCWGCPTPAEVHCL